MTTRVALRMLRAVWAVARCGSAVQAAEVLHLSVSAVTRAVRQAEQLLDVPLFDRGARGMVATPAAALLSARTERAQAALLQGQTRVSALARPAARARAAHANWAQTVTDSLLHTLGAVADTRSESAAARGRGSQRRQQDGRKGIRAEQHGGRPCSSSMAMLDPLATALSVGVMRAASALRLGTSPLVAAGASSARSRSLRRRRSSSFANTL